MGDDVIAERLNLQPRESVVDAFDFLQADNVGGALLQPGQEVLDPLPDRIDVPSSNAHEKDPARNHIFALWHTMCR